MRFLLTLAALAAPLQAQDLEIPADTEIVTTESGLRYSVLARGEGGPKPVRGDRVRVNYSGWTEDGKLFDSSVKPLDPRRPAQPTEFGVGHVIEGWNEGLELMSVGDRFKLTVPAALAYGEEGTPDGAIPPGADLIFEVELLAITAHTLPHLPWPGDEAEGSTALESGVSYRVLEAGQGLESAACKVLVIEFAFWDEAGKVLQSDAMNGRPLIVDPAQAPFAILQEVMPQLRGGAHLLFRAPTSALPGLGFDEFEHVVGQLRVASAMDWAKPEFTLPPDEELTTSASGLRYKILGTGDQFRAGERAMVAAHYVGWLSDGTQFDASYDRGQPLTSPLPQLVAGWQEGMRMIGRGGKVLLVVPPDLGYGDRAQGKIPAGSTLVFVVELIDFQH